MNLLIVGVVVVGAPLIEETVFRALLLNRLAVKWGTRAAIWASALLFGLMHGLSPGIFMLGLSFALIYLSTRGSLRLTMLLHACHNLLAMVISNSLVGLGLSFGPEHSSGWLVAEVLLLSLGALLAWPFYRAQLPSWQIQPPLLELQAAEPTGPAA